MSELKKGWKEATRDMGHGFKAFGKTIARSTKHIVNKVADDDKKDSPKKASEEDIVDVTEIDENTSSTAERVETEPIKESTVFNDGSWKETGKGLGKGFKNMGKMIGKTLATPFTSKEETKKSDDNK